MRKDFFRTGLLNSTHYGEMPRIIGLDAARGAALVAMCCYHLTWDCAYFGLIDPRIPGTDAATLLSHAIAASFLWISGVSLALMALRRPFSWRGYRRRLVTIVLAAGAVTVMSWLLFPDSMILFGILHCIAVASLIALPFFFVPWPWTFAGICFALTLPLFISLPVMDTPAYQWLGLGYRAPVTFDFRPLLPWSGVLLSGVLTVQGGLVSGLLPRSMASGRLHLAIPLSLQPEDAGVVVRPSLPEMCHPPKQTRGDVHSAGSRSVMRILAFGGRYSLLIYLIHQPIFFGLLTLCTNLADHAGAMQPFHSQCVQECTSSSVQRGLCENACTCTGYIMKGLNLWPKLVQNQLDQGERALLAHVAAECAGRSGNARIKMR